MSDSQNSGEVDIVAKPPLDPSLYNLGSEALELWPGHQNDEDLKAHILRVQAKAYEIYGYPCIRGFRFLSCKIQTMPGYQVALEAFKDRNDAVLLDMGCCFGTDLRKAVLDGWPVERVVASDLQPAFWDYGHELFKTTPDTFPAAFIPGDIFSPTLIPPPHEPVARSAKVLPPLPDLRTLTSFEKLRGRIFVIHTSSFFHLFSEERQRLAAKILSSLLSPEKGATIFGRHVAKIHSGSNDGGIPAQGNAKHFNAESVKGNMFRHTPESWKKLWEEDVFGGHGEVEVKASLRDVPRPEYGLAISVMTWSVTRL